jgi:phage shock protein C
MERRHRHMKRLVRPKEGRMIGGVAAAFANYLNIDVTLVRIIWVLLLLPGGLPGFLPYVICWIMIPAETKTQIPTETPHSDS